MKTFDKFLEEQSFNEAILKRRGSESKQKFDQEALKYLKQLEANPRALGNLPNQIKRHIKSSRGWHMRGGQLQRGEQNPKLTLARQIYQAKLDDEARGRQNWIQQQKSPATTTTSQPEAGIEVPRHTANLFQDLVRSDKEERLAAQKRDLARRYPLRQQSRRPSTPSPEEYVAQGR